ncbi:MAG: DNA polymerase IV [Candidatus Omnitrophica bacterium]|nr:DNA polymerase IV [Candidatus Omnitrophota bacterium]MBU1127693.1 DNA polymerase IV [Candidatus Omnitrophota bacterium]MBU1784232.1 DNA polymerase IV [Candidatus Omnitrophota bacterium]MBU1851925.1 DNA polymerase IV [Candidatus Omnitrophota bacterium]
MPHAQKYIIHVDMDAFFTSVEQRDNPALRGKPVIVGSDPKGGKGRGVVAACSYEARAFGIHSAMPISIAYKKCPQAVFLRGSMQKYARESDKILDILEKFTPDIEPISIDEAFMDISGSYRVFGTPAEMCRKIKNTVKRETGLMASIGLAPNKMTAKIASDLNKPDGFVTVHEKDLLNFLHPMPVSKIWGVGAKTKEALTAVGIRTIGDLASYDRAKITELLGKNGSHIWELANGIDIRDVKTDGTTRSVSNEHTFEEDTKNADLIKNTLMSLSEKVSRRLRKYGFKCKTITLKIRFSDFSTFTRAVTIDHPTNFIADLYENCLRHVENFDIHKKSVRLLGVRASNLSDSLWETDLFDGNTDRSKKKEELHKTLDRIKDKFGDGAIGFRGV